MLCSRFKDAAPFAEANGADGDSPPGRPPLLTESLQYAARFPGEHRVLQSPFVIS